MTGATSMHSLAKRSQISKKFKNPRDQSAWVVTTVAWSDVAITFPNKCSCTHYITNGEVIYSV